MTDMREWARALVPDSGKCIGCRDCTFICPEGLIFLLECLEDRKICFPGACVKDCECCVLACPGEALRLVLPEEVGNEQARVPVSERFELSFKLVLCGKCVASFATEKELEWVFGAIIARGAVSNSASAYVWKELCPSCRQAALRERETGAVLRSRRFLKTGNKIQKQNTEINNGKNRYKSGQAIRLLFYKTSAGNLRVCNFGAVDLLLSSIKNYSTIKDYYTIINISY